jgi:hypothetical protein
MHDDFQSKRCTVQRHAKMHTLIPHLITAWEAVRVPTAEAHDHIQAVASLSTAVLEDRPAAAVAMIRMQAGRGGLGALEVLTQACSR